MKIFTILLLFISLASTKTYAQSDSVPVDEMMVNTSFLIIKSTKNYESALQTAKVAALKLDYTLNLRGMIPDSSLGLTSIDTCGCGEFHGYIARGRFDSGHYVSIEYSDAYTGFTEGYFVVVVSSGAEEDVKLELPSVKKIFNDAYIKRAPVYMGCMH